MATKMHEFSARRDPVGPGKKRDAQNKPKVYRGNWTVTVPMAAVAVAYVMLIFLPGRRTIGDAQAQIEQKQQYLTGSTGLATTLCAAEEELGTSQAYSSLWESHSPNPTGISALYGKINALAKATGTTTTNFDPEPVVSYDQLREIPLTIGCTGSFRQILEFLRMLEDLPETIWVNRLQVEKIDQNADSVKCEIALVVFASNPKNSD